MKGAHYLNTPTGFETVFNIAKSFLNEKNRNRVRFTYKIVYLYLLYHIYKTTTILFFSCMCMAKILMGYTNMCRKMYYRQNTEETGVPSKKLQVGPYLHIL